MSQLFDSGVVTIAACPLVVFSVGVWLGLFSAADDRFEIVFRVFVTTMSMVLATVVGGLIASSIGEVLPRAMDDDPSHTAALVSIRSADGLSGTIRGGIFMLAGNIGTEQYYFYYEQFGDAVTPRQVRAGRGIYVYEQAREDARVEVRDWHFTSRWWSAFAIEPDGETYRFYVPTGSVKKQFTLE